MRTLVKKMSKLGLLKVELVVGTLIMAAAMLGLPIGILAADPALMANPYILGVVAIGMLFFGLVGYFCFIRPYVLYRKLPSVQAETDGEYLYIHTKKEAKIPLSALSSATVYTHLPFLYQKEFLREFLIHIFSDEYGDIVLEIPGYGKYKMRFVAHVKEEANALHYFLQGVMNSEIF